MIRLIPFSDSSYQNYYDQHFSCSLIATDSEERNFAFLLIWSSYCWRRILNDLLTAWLLFPFWECYWTQKSLVWVTPIAYREQLRCENCDAGMINGDDLLSHIHCGQACARFAQRHVAFFYSSAFAAKSHICLLLVMSSLQIRDVQCFSSVNFESKQRLRLSNNEHR